MIYFLAFSLCLGIASAFELNICADKLDGVFVREHSSCANYIACYNQMALFGACPPGFAFNPINSMCDYPENVNCDEICPKDGTSTFRFEKSCTKYVRCIGGHASFVECPQGLYYDHHHGNCNLPEETDCEALICQGSGSYLVPSHEDCGAYYECTNYVATVRTCSPDLWYNHETQMCDLKKNVKCIMVPEIIEEEDDGYNADVEISCPPTGAHFYPHPSDCQHYFLCVNGISALLDCGHNMVYDYAEQKCDLASRATCITAVL